MSAKSKEAELVTTEQPSKETQPMADKKMQTTITIAIIASVLLFFAGLGLGFFVGRQTATDTFERGPMNSRTRPGTFDGSRLRDRINTDDNTGTGSSNSTTQEN